MFKVAKAVNILKTSIGSPLSLSFVKLNRFSYLILFFRSFFFFNFGIFWLLYVDFFSIIFYVISSSKLTKTVHRIPVSCIM